MTGTAVTAVVQPLHVPARARKVHITAVTPVARAMHNLPWAQAKWAGMRPRCEFFKKRR